MQHLIARVLTSAALYFGTKLIEEIICEMERTEKKVSEKAEAKRFEVLPRAIKVLSGGKE